MAQAVKILGVAPYKGLLQCMQKVAATRSDLTLTGFVADRYTIRNFITEFNLRDYDVLISRGGTAERLRALTDAPVVEVGVSFYDIVASLQGVPARGTPLAVVANPSIAQYAGMLSTLTDSRVVVRTVDESDERSAVISEVKAAGCRLVLGDLLTIRAARNLGMETRLIESGEKSVEDALEEAVHQAKRQHVLLGQNRLLQALLGQLSPGLLLFDPGGDCRYAHQSLSADVVQAIGQALPGLGLPPFAAVIDGPQGPLPLNGRSMVLDGSTFTAVWVGRDDIPGLPLPEGWLAVNLNRPFEETKARVFGAAVAHAGGNQAEAARRLKISRTTLWAGQKTAEQTGNEGDVP